MNADTEKFKPAWRIVMDSSMLVSMAGVIFWCGNLSQQIADLNRTALTIDEDKGRIEKIQARQDMVITTIAQIDHRLERIEENQQAILREVRR